MKSPADLDHVFIDQKSLDSEVAKRALIFFPAEKISVVKEQPWSEVKGALSAKEFDRSKRNLFITPFEGIFFKRCPGAHQKRALPCCNYYVLNLGSQCNMNCSYCYLQSYLNTPIMKVYSNIDMALEELSTMSSQFGHLPYRVGTGEITDSLSLDEFTLYSRVLIDFFKKQPHWLLELKTKSNSVDQFLDLGPAPQVVVSWSLNAAHIIEREELGTASLSERLAAAKKCVEAGFKVAFHLDPLLWHPEWEDSYQSLVDQITEMFQPEQVHSLSVGTLRYQPEQRHLMRERFGFNSYVTQAEMFPSEGQKLRYDLNLRNEMYSVVISEFKKNSPAWRIFPCMETPESWISSLEGSPMQVEGLQDFFRPLPKITSVANQTLKNMETV